VKILVIGGTGTVGKSVIEELLKAGESVRCLTRSANKIKTLPAGVHGHLGNLENPDSLLPAFKGVDAVFLLVSVSQNETKQGLTAVDIAKTTDVKKMVYMSVHMPEDSKHIPHFRSKIPIEEAVRKSGIAYTILRPNNFYQNDLLFKEIIMTHNIYPQPIGSIGINRVDVRDIAQAAVTALIKSGHEEQEYPVHGPDILTGEKVSEIYSNYLGQKICYGGDDLNVWAEGVRDMMPDWMIHDFRIMYQYFQEHGFIASDADFEQQLKILGREPHTFDTFIAGITPAWKNAVRIA
jgi:uncharacterized protein YbjT (DUF2867 family)